MSGKDAGAAETRNASRRVTVELDEFGRQALERECRRLGVSDGELLRFALLYYLADIDSGRIARRIPDMMLSGSDEPQPHPFG